MEWVIDPAAWVAGTYLGHEGVREFFARVAEAFDRLQLEVDSFLDAGDAVVTLGRTRVSRLSGRESNLDISRPGDLSRDDLAVTVERL